MERVVMSENKPVTRRLKRREVDLALQEMRRTFYGEFLLDQPRGSALPSVQELARLNKVSNAIARKFYDQLQQEGIVVSKERKGFFIAESFEQGGMAGVLEKPPLIGVVAYLDKTLPETAYSLAGKILESFEKTINENGWGIHFFNTYPNTFVTPEFLLDMAKARLDAILVLTSARQEQDVELLRALELPTITTEFPSDYATNIQFDHRLFSENASAYLCECGFKRIAYFSDVEKSWGEERKCGYLNVLKKHKMKPICVELKHHGGDYEACVDDLQRQKVDAVFAVNDQAAMALKVAGLDMSTVALMGIDDRIEARTANLTTIQLNRQTVAECAFTQLVNYFVHQLPLPREITLGGLLLKRSSTELLRPRKRCVLRHERFPESRALGWQPLGSVHR
jgi:DNA-binding LacI/PurR family transcriptional regulator